MENNQEKNKWLTTLLLASFLGYFGAHRFYNGKYGTGIAMLLTCGGCGIWVIVDIIMIGLETFTDANGKAITSQTDKERNIASYFNTICMFRFLYSKKVEYSKNTRIHAAQSLSMWGINIMVALLSRFVSIILNIFINLSKTYSSNGLVMILGILSFLISAIVMIISIANLVFIIIAVINAAQGKEDPAIPVIGNIAKKIFKSKINV